MIIYHWILRCRILVLPWHTLHNSWKILKTCQSLILISETPPRTKIALILRSLFIGSIFSFTVFSNIHKSRIGQRHSLPVHHLNATADTNFLSCNQRLRYLCDIFLQNTDVFLLLFSRFENIGFPNVSASN